MVLFIGMYEYKHLLCCPYFSSPITITTMFIFIAISFNIYLVIRYTSLPLSIQFNDEAFLAAMKYSIEDLHLME